MEWPQNSLLHSPCLEQFLEMSFDRGVHSSRPSGIQSLRFSVISKRKFYTPLLNIFCAVEDLEKQADVKCEFGHLLRHLFYIAGFPPIDLE